MKKERKFDFYKRKQKASINSNFKGKSVVSMRWGLLYLLPLIFTVFSAQVYTNSWCFNDSTRIVTYKNVIEGSCDYEKLGRGFITYTDARTEVFEIRTDCCASNDWDVEYNQFHIINYEDNYTLNSNPKKIVFKFKGTPFARLTFNITIEEYNPLIYWAINTYYILSGSTITFIGRNTTPQTPRISLSVESRQFYLETPLSKSTESVDMDFQWGFSPSVFVNGNFDIKLTKEIDRTECQYRYTLQGGIVTMSVTNPHLTMKNVCTSGVYNRISVCPNTILDDYEDCSCVYSDYEYHNHEHDCTYLSQYFDFKALPKQDKVPYEYKWRNLVTTGEDTVLSIRKGSNMTFLQEVNLPEHNLTIEGSVIFLGGIKINGNTNFYDLGNFHITSVDYSAIQDLSNTVLFVGKCSMGERECSDLMNQSELQEERCNGTKSRFVVKGSTFGCTCTQSNGMFKQNDCEYMTLERMNRIKLEMSSDYNSGNTEKYWESIEVVNPSPHILNVYGNSIVVANDCNFMNAEIVHINCTLRCGKIILSSSTRIIATPQSVIKTYQIEVKGVVTNLNEGALIQMNGGSFISDGSMQKEFDSDQITCFELVSGSSALSESLHNSKDGKYETYVIDHLLRVCVENMGNIETNTEIICQVKNSVFGTFEYEQCPCHGTNCRYQFDESESFAISTQNTFDVIIAILEVTKPLHFINVREVNVFTIKDESVLHLEGSDKVISVQNDFNEMTTIVNIGNAVINGQSKFIQITNEQQNEVQTKLVIGGEFTSAIFVLQDDATLIPKTTNSIISLQNNQKTPRGLLESGVRTLTYSTRSKCQVGHFEEDKFVCDSCGQGEVSGKCKENQIIDRCNQYGSTGLCITCNENYYLDTKIVNNEIESQHCVSCTSFCKKCNSTQCIQCKEQYKLKDGWCVPYATDCVFYSNGLCKKCSENYYTDGQKCIKCRDNCKSCTSSVCLVCDTNYKNVNGNCETLENTESVTSSSVISCSNSYYNNNTKCELCRNTFGDGCRKCNKKMCFECSSDFIIENGNCVLKGVSQSNCHVFQNFKCMKCNDGFYNPPLCIPCAANCLKCTGSQGICVECNTTQEDLWLQNGVCITNTPLQSIDIKSQTLFTRYLNNNSMVLSIGVSQCTTNNYGRCLRCTSGFYLETTINNPISTSRCAKCGDGCDVCLQTSTFCLSCSDAESALYNHTCVANEDAKEKCQQLMISKLGCAVCNEKYYRKNTDCIKCPSTMATCLNENQPIQCNTGFFMYQMKECRDFSELTNCSEKSEQSGCTKCDRGYFVKDSYCTKCSQNCDRCTQEKSCELCSDNYVLSHGTCVNYSYIDKCSASSNNFCESCEKGYELNPNNRFCTRKSLWWISLIVIPVFLIFVVVLYIVITFLFRRFIKIQQDNTLDLKEVFLHERFSEIVPGILINKKVLCNEDGKGIPVGQESLFKLILANHGKHKVKVQPIYISSKKYEITITPELVFLRPNKAMEFTIKIVPNCTTQITQKISFSVYLFKYEETKSFDISIDLTTDQSSILDPDELIQTKKIGEGTFGVVYYGTFRGNKVAIKKLKIQSNEGGDDEFSREVEMLEKFKSEYIVHFYGAVMIKDDRSVITEFAKYGSVQNLIESKTKKYNKIITKKLRIKLLEDCACGIEYLHNNGILHRDIKPDNMLVFSLENNITVNAKLTDFGSARNINLMMTNMTFTKGVGTPSYMAPEVLLKKKYKTPADIFSFGVTIYSVMIWGDPYPKNEFPYPWNVATFVSDGRRQPKLNLTNEEYKLVSDCWDENPITRLKIAEVISRLKTLIVIRKSFRFSLTNK
ncbi:protein serine/threonine kinase, putative [Entamoeba invadens IP1]|uniref:Protein serine/threonine kinase, putative n=1 Tax=Entamoeba invadens IP1 TaxID=370355 RepID=A0A0A1U8X0_ENTIV|nr:protein serine/threonine kinase, putative [Entamoeba invadens IP1]ELP89571.1 protein serine/threonine kinase, putative [Entamoeba invadens IP1]|eukprot:XP_004256342.1 protein serine/threonine kinase, putative [Entamoeba invadens IP1]